MTLLLILVVLLLLFGGGYYGSRQWGAPGGLGIVGLIIAIILILWLLGVVPLRGQEAPSPSVSATPIIAFADPVATATIEAPLPVPVATVVPAPPDATTAEVKAVAEHSADTLKQVADGDVSLPEATRDADDSPDPGSNTFWVLALIFGTVVRPITDKIVSNIPAVDDKLSGAINTAALLLVYLGAWALLRTGNPSLPQDWLSWAIAAFSAAGLGSATTGSIRSMSNDANKPASL